MCGSILTAHTHPAGRRCSVYPKPEKTLLEAGRERRAHPGAKGQVQAEATECGRQKGTGCEGGIGTAALHTADCMVHPADGTVYHADCVV